MPSVDFVIWKHNAEVQQKHRYAIQIQFGCRDQHSPRHQSPRQIGKSDFTLLFLVGIYQINLFSNFKMAEQWPTVAFRRLSATDVIRAAIF